MRPGLIEAVMPFGFLSSLGGAIRGVCAPASLKHHVIHYGLGPWVERYPGRMRPGLIEARIVSDDEFRV